MDCIVLDVETTGVYNNSDVIQVAGLMLLEDGLSMFNRYCNTDQKISQGSYEVHGLSKKNLASLSGGKYFEDVAQELKDVFSRDLYVIGHGVNFDIRMMNNNLSKHGFPELNVAKKYCTMKKANQELKKVGVRGNVSLEKMLDYVLSSNGMELEEFNRIALEHIHELTGEEIIGGQHDAAYDVYATYICFAYLELGEFLC